MGSNISESCMTIGERRSNLLHGATETLESIQKMKDIDNQPVFLGLVSDFGLSNNLEIINRERENYYRILKKLDLDCFFKPLNQRVTLSIEIGVQKPKEEFFRKAIDRISHGLSFADVIFITEKKYHVDAVRPFSPVTMNAIHFKGPGQQNGEIEKLEDLIPKIQEFTFSHFNIKS